MKKRIIIGISCGFLMGSGAGVVVYYMPATLGWAILWGSVFFSAGFWLAFVRWSSSPSVKEEEK